MKRILRPETALFLGLWLILIIGGQSRFFRDPGTFWHVTVGDRIMDAGFFDKDPFSFTFGGQDWIPHQWLGEIAMALIHRALGFDGLLLVTVTLLAGLYTGLGVRLMRAGFHPSVTCVLVAAGLAASAMHFHIRPHIATIIGMAVVMVYLTDIEAGRISIRRAWWLVPIFWLWANCHGGVLGGLVTMLMAGGGWLLAFLLKRTSPITSWGDFGKLILIWFVCFAMCFLNPYYHRLLLTWIQIYQMSSLPQIIEEHAPLQLDNVSGITVLAFAGLYLLMFFGALPRLRVVWLLPIVWGLLAYTRIRHAPLFAVITLVAMADVFPFTRYAKRLIEKKNDLFLPKEDEEEERTVGDEASGFIIPACLLGMSILFQMAGFSIPVVGRNWASFNPEQVPIELIPELKANQYLRPGGTRIFNEFNYGGMLIHFTPGYRVFVDDRCELYGDKFLIQFTGDRIAIVSEGFDHPGEPLLEWQAEYGSFDMALVETQGPFDLALWAMPDAWEEVKRTKTAVLYRKIQ